MTQPATRPSPGRLAPPPLPAAVVQRATSKDNWASTENREDAQNIASQVSKNAKQSGTQDIFAHGYAIHHKISKEHLSTIARANQDARQEGLEGAKRFWKAVVKATKNVVDKGARDDKRMWNIPANLEVGPYNVTNNPGMGFDANTVPVTGGRRRTLRSDELHKLLQIFQNADDEPTDEDWEEMAEALETANQQQDNLVQSGLTLPLEEQWVKTGVGTGFTRQ